jgi:protein involved in ribonucleotide reduction
LKKLPIIVLSIGIAGLILSCDAILLLDNTRSSGDPLWVKSNSGSIKSSFTSVFSIDEDFFTLGHLEKGTIQFGNNISATGSYVSGNPLFAKFSKTGSPIWATSNLPAGGLSSVGIISILKDGIYGIGSGTGSFLSKYLENGNCLWSNTITGNFVGLRDACILNSDIYAIGNFGDRDGGSLDFGNGILLNQTSMAGNPIFVKYNRDGQLQRALTIPVGEFTCLQFSSMAVAGDSIFITGLLQGSSTVGTDVIDFGNSVNLSVSTNTIIPYLAKFNTTGDAQWVKTITSGDSGTTFIKIVANGNDIYAVGTIAGNNSCYFDFSIMARGPDPNKNCVLVKYNLNGSVYWARTLLNGGSSEFTGVAVTDDAVYVSGSLGGFALANFGFGVTLEATNYSNPVLVKYDLNGTALWAKTITPQTSGMQAAKFNSIAVDNEGVYAVGSIGKGIYSLGTRGTIQGGADENYLIIKYKK